MGFTPQLVDFDGDGTPDVLSGSWPGELYLFKGLGKGKYAPARKIKGKDGKPINTGDASTVFAADWRGTGKLDLLVGSIEGSVWLVPNEGTKEKPAFGKPVKLSAGGKEIRVDRDSHPIVADWERTGKPGLVVGCGDGSVLWFRNEGSRKEPKLATPVTLVTAGTQGDPRKASKEAPRGTRAKVCVVDWNGDGLPDLLVGDFSMTYGEEPKLSEAERKKKKEIEERLRKVEKEIAEGYSKEVRKLSAKADLKTPAGVAEFKKKIEPLKEKYKKALDEDRRLYGQLQKYQRPYFFHGQVWLFLRQPAGGTASR